MSVTDLRSTRQLPVDSRCAIVYKLHGRAAVQYQCERTVAAGRSCSSPRGRVGMAARGKWLLAIAFVILAPRLVLAQASITGVVKDPTGAVLPGVTVEAASDVLIERIRTVTTDGTGQYRIVDLRPGMYALTFTLTGFNTLKREGIELA